MNIKLHTPESLKKGSGMSSGKQFLLSLLATTISIALTFGTAAIIDYKKKQKEKREIVMMVMYDMYNSMMSIEKADSSFRQSMEVQRQMAENPDNFEKFRFQMASHFLQNKNKKKSKMHFKVLEEHQTWLEQYVEY